jgi:hypothetical protein
MVAEMSGADIEARIRAGWRPSIADKISDTQTSDELDAFLAALRARGYQMTAEDVIAVRDARKKFGRLA